MFQSLPWIKLCLLYYLCICCFFRYLSGIHFFYGWWMYTDDSWSVISRYNNSVWYQLWRRQKTVTFLSFPFDRYCWNGHLRYSERILLLSRWDTWKFTMFIRVEKMFPEWMKGKSNFSLVCHRYCFVWTLFHPSRFSVKSR